jgi:hypothetical protein
MQKMARDLMASGGSTSAEKLSVAKLGKSLMKKVQSGSTKRQAWDLCFEGVYELAQVHIDSMFRMALAKL